MNTIKSSDAALLVLIFVGVVSSGRKGGSAGAGDEKYKQQFEEPTVLPTGEYFFVEDYDVILANYSVLDNSLNKAMVAAEELTRYNNDIGGIELCTYCNEELGASTTDVECRDNARKVCWASTGCYRLTFMDKLSATYHIAKGCWYEDFSGRFDLCKRECSRKRDNLPDPEEREDCFCELCHGPMCNKQILRSGAERKRGWGVVVFMLAAVWVVLK